MYRVHSVEMDLYRVSDILHSVQIGALGTLTHSSSVGIIGTRLIGLESKKGGPPGRPRGPDSKAHSPWSILDKCCKIDK
jgi:hypothetical protein